MKRLDRKVHKKAAKVKLLLLDVDGVLTDGGIIIDSRGGETKRFDVKDGQGIALLVRAGITVGFVTSRSSRVVARRAKELGVGIVYQGVQDKADAYNEIKKNTGFQDEQIAFVGDDISDLPLMRRVGLAVAVKDSWPGVRLRADYVTQARGGCGAVREVSELLLKAQNTWRKLLTY
ncbi:MAG TPA: HAD-IIIA family hydrolase [Candidatus Acidoferrales bacterium]|nr:HAD-IIIA family hydrolase [Candidatus Acidoferrales bacterium]